MMKKTVMRCFACMDGYDLGGPDIPISDQIVIV